MYMGFEIVGLLWFGIQILLFFMILSFISTLYKNEGLKSYIFLGCFLILLIQAIIYLFIFYEYYENLIFELQLILFIVTILLGYYTRKYEYFFKLLSIDLLIIIHLLIYFYISMIAAR